MNRSFYKFAILLSILPVGAFANDPIEKALGDMETAYQEKCRAHNVTERLFSTEPPFSLDTETANEFTQARQTVRDVLKEMHDTVYRAELETIKSLRDLVPKKDRKNFIKEHPNLDPATADLLLEPDERFSQHFHEES